MADPKPIKLLRKRLDDAGVAAHFAALAAEARSIEIRVKGGTAAYSEATSDDLAQTAQRLRAGEITAVQIHFVQDDAWWCDTVMRAGEIYRLVRMRQDGPGSE